MGRSCRACLAALSMDCRGITVVLRSLPPWCFFLHIVTDEELSLRLIRSPTQSPSIPELVSRDFAFSESPSFFYNCTIGPHPILRHSPTILPVFLCHIFPAIS